MRWQNNDREKKPCIVGHNGSPPKEGDVDTATGEAAREATPMIALRSGSHTGDPALMS